MRSSLFVDRLFVDLWVWPSKCVISLRCMRGPLVVCWLSYTGVVSAVFHSRCVLAIVAEKRGCGRDISQKWVKIFESNENR